MGFETFDLKRAIRKYNATPQGESKPISIDETFGVFTLSPEFTQEILQKGFDSYKNSKFHHTGITEFSRQIATNLKHSVNEFVASIGTKSPGKSQKSVSELGKEVRDGLGVRREDQYAQAQFQSKQDTVESLLSKELWEKFEKIAEDNQVKKRQLEEIQAELQQHGRFCTHAHASLLAAYDILLAIALVLEQARKEYESAKRRRVFNKIPLSILHDWEAYLDAQEALYKKERDDIVAHILARLSIAASDPTLRNADVLCRFVGVLKSKGFLKESFTTPQIKGDELSQEQFIRFHLIVDSQGDEVARKKLFELPWFGGVASDELSLKENLAKRYEVSELVPKRRLIPNFLFYWVNIRLKWVEDYSGQARIDAALKKVKLQKDVFAPFSERLPNLLIAEKEFEAKDQEIENEIQVCRRGLRRFYTRKTVLFLETIRRSFLEQRLELVKEKVEVLAKMKGELDEKRDSQQLQEGFQPQAFVRGIESDLVKLNEFFSKPTSQKEGVKAKIQSLKQTFQEQKTLVERRLSIIKARDEENEEKADIERHEEALLEPFYSGNVPNLQETANAFDYLEIGLNALKSENYAKYIKEMKAIYYAMKESFKRELAGERDAEKLRRMACFLNSYKEMAMRRQLKSDEKRVAAIELCRLGDRARIPEEALRHYSQAIELDPNYLSAWRKKGDQLWALHKDITSSDEELNDDNVKDRLAKSGVYLLEAQRCFEKPLSMSPAFTHPLVREALAERVIEYFCQWIGIGDKQRVSPVELAMLHQKSAQIEDVLIAISGVELSERVEKMKSLRESGTDFSTLENLAKDGLLFVIKTMPFALQLAVDNDFTKLGQELMQFLKEHVQESKDDGLGEDSLEDTIKEMVERQSFEYKDLKKMDEDSKDYLRSHPEVHSIVSMIAKMRFEARRIASTLEPSDKKQKVCEVNKFVVQQEKRFFEVSKLPGKSNETLATLVKIHGNFKTSLSAITRVEEAVSVVRKTR